MSLCAQLLDQYTSGEQNVSDETREVFWAISIRDPLCCVAGFLLKEDAHFW